MDTPLPPSLTPDSEPVAKVGFPSLNTVSWQSAFWAPVPVALNSMTQPSGMVCDLPSQYSVALRSSPIICVADALFMLIPWIWSTATKKSPTSAAQKLVRERFRDVAAESNPTSLSTLQENLIFRVAIFVIGAVPQIIKLYSMGGIPLTKTWASMYLGSFAIVELLMILGRNWKDSPQPTGLAEGGIRKQAIGFILTCLGLAHSYYFFTLSVLTVVEENIGKIGWANLVVFLFLALVYLCILLTDEELLLMLGLFLVVPVLGFFAKGIGVIVMVLLTPTSIVVLLILNHFHALLFIGVGSTSLVALGLAILTFLRLVKLVKPIRVYYFHSLVSTYILGINLLTAILYYRFCYDPKDTIKPVWTDQLG